MPRAVNSVATRARRKKIMKFKTKYTITFNLAIFLGLAALTFS